MSLIPFILDLADELHEFSRCLANGIDINDFGFGLYTASDQQQPQHQQQQQQQSSPRRSRTSSFSSLWMPSKRHHPYNRIKTACCARSGEDSALTPEKLDATPTSSSSSSSIGGTPGKSASYSVVNKNGFQVSMNVKQFAPNELSVKTIDNCIVVEGRHDDKEDGHGVISRHFVRKYMLPKGYDPNDVLSTLSSDGILTVKAPPPPPPSAKNDESNERIIEIQPTPGPTTVVVVSAKETPTKETTKKVATPSARLECQLPEKRQKLDLPPEPESTDTVKLILNTTMPSTPPPLSSLSAIANTNETLASAAAITTVEESQDVEMEKVEEEHITEIVIKKPEIQKTDVAPTAENSTEKKNETKEQEQIVVETEQNPLEELTKKVAAESNGETKKECEKMEESCNSITDAATTTIVVVVAAETAIKSDATVENSNVTKMEIDGDNENVNNANDDGMKNDNTTDHVNVATEKIEIETDSEKTNNIDNSSNSSNNISNNIGTTDATTTNNINATNSTNATATNTSAAEAVKDGGSSDGNGVVTGKIPVDIPQSSADCADADTAVVDAVVAATATVTTDSKAESAICGEPILETAVVLNTDTTTTTTTTTIIMDEVALLKAATADPAIITDKGDEENNIILTEAIDGISATTETAAVAAAAADSVECSLFAKKTHLGNGNNATALVGTEEVAN